MANSYVSGITKFRSRFRVLAEGILRAYGMAPTLTAFVVLDAAALSVEASFGPIPFHPAAGLAFALVFTLGPMSALAVPPAYALSAILLPELRATPLASLIQEGTWVAVGYGATAWILRRYFRTDLMLRRNWDVSRFVLAGLLTSLAVGAAVGTTRATMGLLQWHDLRGFLIRFWLQDALGILTLSPFLLIHLFPRLGRKSPKRRSAKGVSGGPVEADYSSSALRPTRPVAVVQALSIPAVLITVLSLRSSVAFDLYYWFLMPTIWISSRWGLAGATLSILGTNLGASVGATLVRFGPAEHGAMQVVLMTVCLTGLFLGNVVTARARTRQRLLAAKVEAERASRAKTEFLAVVSHELHTPMNSILGYTELLLDRVEGEINQAQEQSLRRVDHQARHLLTLIDALLDVARLEADGWIPERTPCRVRETIAEIVRASAADAERKGLRLAYRIVGDVPDRLLGDPRCLRSGVAGLIDNAIKFTERGAVNLLVRREWQPGGEVCLRFSVSDTGIGIPEDRLAEIFEAFSQVESSSTRVHGGLGLGLTIAHGIARAMGGSLSVESQVGVGSTFHMTACFRQPEDSQDSAQATTAGR